MKAEVISMRDVLEIFADYLEQNEDVEVVQSRKMGVFTIFDGSGVSCQRSTRPGVSSKTIDMDGDVRILL